MLLGPEGGGGKICKQRMKEISFTLMILHLCLCVSLTTRGSSHQGRQLICHTDNSDVSLGTIVQSSRVVIFSYLELPPVYLEMPASAVNRESGKEPPIGTVGHLEHNSKGRQNRKGNV